MGMLYGCIFAWSFLSCGTITNPEKEYHVEFVVPYMNLANDLQDLLKIYKSWNYSRLLPTERVAL